MEDTRELCANERSDLKHKYREMDLDNLKPLLMDSEISKNQKKKIMKQIKWLESADNRRELRKKRKLRYKEMNKQAATVEGYVKRKKIEKITSTANFHQLFHVALDLSFDEQMTSRDLRKLAKQIGWCYKQNRRSTCAVQYHLCGLDGRLKDKLDPSHINWDVHFDGKVLESFSKDKITYLTAESPHVLDKLEAGRVYVIGGLVDHNHKKGTCQKLAEEKDIATAHLPLVENVDMITRKVLTVNHVFEILLAYQECKSWKNAILKILPPKKFTSTESCPTVNPTPASDSEVAKESLFKTQQVT